MIPRLTQKNLFFVFSHCEDKNKCKVLLEHLYALLQIDPKVCPLKHGYFDNPISELTARLNQKIDDKEIRKDKKVVDSFVNSVKALQEAFNSMKDLDLVPTEAFVAIYVKQREI